MAEPSDTPPAVRPLTLHTPRLTERLAEGFVKFLQAGHSFRATCRHMGIPRATAQRWRDTNPDFDERLRAAEDLRGPGPNGRPDLYSDEIAETVLAGLARGEPLHEICARPGVPCERTVMGWVHEDRHFRQRYLVARDVAVERQAHDAVVLARGATRETAAADRLAVATMRWNISRSSSRRYGGAFGAEPDEADDRPRVVVIRDYRAEMDRDEAVAELKALKQRFGLEEPDD